MQYAEQGICNARPSVRLSVLSIDGQLAVCNTYLFLSVAGYRSACVAYVATDHSIHTIFRPVLTIAVAIDGRAISLVLAVFYSTPA